MQRDRGKCFVQVEGAVVEPNEGHAQVRRELQRSHPALVTAEKSTKPRKATLFDGPRLTLERAKHHVRDLDKVVADLRREALQSGSRLRKSTRLSLSARKSFVLQSLPQTFGMVAPSLVALKAPKHYAGDDKRGNRDNCGNPTHPRPPFSVQGWKR